MSYGIIEKKTLLFGGDKGRLHRKDRNRGGPLS